MAEHTEVWLIENEADDRDLLKDAISSAGHLVRTYSTPQLALQAYSTRIHCCFVIDLQLPDINGLALWKKLRQRGCQGPAVFIADRPDVGAVVSAMQLGAINFLERPLELRRLLESVNVGVQHERLQREHNQMVADIASKINSLTDRENQVMRLVASGMLTKQIATKLGISTKTVEVHRSNITEKMGVSSVAQLVRLVTRYDMSTDYELSP